MSRRTTTTGLAMATLGAGGLAAAAVLVAPATSSATGTGVAGGERVAMAAAQRNLPRAAHEAFSSSAGGTAAGGTERMLRQILGSDFAGAWVAPGGHDLTVAVTTRTAAAQVRRAGAVPRLVRHSEAQLTTFKSHLDRAGGTKAGVTSFYVDPASNQVVVSAKPGDRQAAQDWAASNGVPTDAVRVVTTEAAPRLMFDVKGGDAFFIDNKFRCSIGFSVVGGFVSAGHCGEPGSVTTGFNSQAQGTFQASTFPGTGDFSFVKVNGNWTPQPVVATKDGDVPVAGSQEAPVGAAICRTGSTTGTHCGVIQAKNATVNYPEGQVTGLTQTDVCAEGGDSGGSWMSGDEAQGVTSGGSGDCTVGGTTFFQPLNEILDVDKLQLITTADQGGAADAPPAGGGSSAGAGTSDDCNADQAKGLNGRGLLAFFRSAGGRQQACISGSAGTQVSLSLQKWTGTHWQTVARAVSTGPAEQLTFDGPAGFYRYQVTSAQRSAKNTVRVNAS